jgi:hypothetical protein
VDPYLQFLTRLWRAKGQHYSMKISGIHVPVALPAVEGTSRLGGAPELVWSLSLTRITFEDSARTAQ